MNTSSLCRHDVVCGEHNLLESEVTLLTPWAVPDRRGSTAYGSRCPPPSPSETVHEFWSSAPGHIATASVIKVNLLRSNPTSFSNWMPSSLLMKREVRNCLLASPSSSSEARPMLFCERTPSLLGAAGTLGLQTWYDQSLFLMKTTQCNTTQLKPPSVAKRYTLLTGGPHWLYITPGWEEGGTREKDEA